MNSLKLNKFFFKSYLESLIIFLLVFIDYFSKEFFTTFLGYKKINLIGDYLFLKIYNNTGIAFSIQLPFLNIITIFIIICIVYYYIKYEKIKNNFFINISFILIISGALGNAWQRIFLGKVTDFIGVKYFSIFNFADIYINIGIITYLIIITLKKDKDGI